VLLVGAGLMAKSLNKLENQDFGVETENRIVAHISPDNAGYKPEQLQALYERIDQGASRFAGSPEGRFVSVHNRWRGTTGVRGVYIQGRPEPAAE